VALFILLSLVVLNLLTRLQWLSVNVWTIGLLVLAGAFLALGLGGFFNGLSALARRPQSYTLSLLIILGTTYVLPVLLLIALIGLLRQPIPNLFLQQTQQDLLQQLMPASWFPGQPWLLLWQAIFLAGLGLALPRQQTRRATLNHCLSGLMVGLGLGLGGLYLYSLLSTIFHLDGLNPLPFNLIWLLQVLVAVLILPWASERLFRGALWQTLRAQLGERSALWLGAALYATVQLRPLVWLPAFALGLALTQLTLHQSQMGTEAEPPSLLPATIAHTAANLVLLVANIYLPI
jgi:hypothetical protein